jgi:prephenate dehydrogenase
VRISIVGFGLIGGSIAKALSQRDPAGAWHVTAWSRTMEPVRQAVADGCVHVAAEHLEAAVEGAEIVVLAAPPLTCLEIVDRLARSSPEHLDPDCTVTDVASAKREIVMRADAAGLPFIGGHPMAGRELSGYVAALPDLFVERPWVTVLGSGARLCDGERVAALIEACGAIQVPMQAEAHDRAVAAVSHMPLIVAAALVEAVAGSPGGPERPDWRAARALAATGWAGMTRLARGEPGMGAGIAATNAAAIAARLRDVRSAIDEWLALLEGVDGPDAAELADRFESARERLLASDAR